MNIIPVIDLQNGEVVHARRGDRANYQALRSNLCQGSEPLCMVHALLQLYPFTSLYIADLDAIQQRGDHLVVVQAIQRAYPQLNIWLDAGFTATTALSKAIQHGIRPVLGSESLHDLAHYQQLVSACQGHHVLSLDFKAQRYEGPAQLLADSRAWPQQVIAMTLSRVGSQSGPDLQQLAALQPLAASHQLYAAGGIRNMQDLATLQQRGIQGALVASALHDGSLTSATLTVMANMQDNA